MSIPSSPLARLLSTLFALASLIAVAGAQHDPTQGLWGKESPDDVRVMTWNVKDAICRTNPKLEGQNNWNSCVRIVAAMQPDILILQECGDNSGNGTGSGVDSVVNLNTTLNLFFAGGNDPFLGGTVTSYVQKYAPGYDLPFRFVSSETDGFNRNCVLSRFPFLDQNGDGISQYPDIPTILSDEYAPGGDGGIRGFQILEVGLPSDIYAGKLVVGNAHLKAGGSSGDMAQRETAARNVAYFVDYLLNGAGTGVPDPNGRILDSPAVTQILGPDTGVILGGDWNEEENGGPKGPAAWLTQAAQLGGTDGTDKDRSDMTWDDARHPFTGDPDTVGNVKFDYIAWQDSVLPLRLSFLFDSSGVPLPLLPPELSGMPNPGGASSTASDHRAVICDFDLATNCESMPSNYCEGAPNSLGPGAVMTWLGSTSIAQNDFTLFVQGAAAGQPGLFFYGPATTQVPFGDGFLCVGTGGLGVFRLFPALVTDAFGDANRLLDFTQAPAGSGPGSILASSTWHFQFWFRDPNGPLGNGFNLSDGLSAIFCD